jgi:hypothetical protein
MGLRSTIVGSAIDRSRIEEFENDMKVRQNAKRTISIAAMSIFCSFFLDLTISTTCDESADASESADRFGHALWN